MDLTIFSKSERSKPSLITIALFKDNGFTPITEISFNVPAADILPISPPGKNKGCTV